MIINNLVDVLATLSFYKMSNSCRMKYENKGNQWYSIIEGVDLENAFKEINDFLNELNIKQNFHGIEIDNLQKKNGQEFNRSFKDKIKKDHRVRCVANESFTKKDIITTTPLLQFSRGQNKLKSKWESNDSIKLALSDLLSNKIIKNPPIPCDENLDDNFKGYETYASGLCLCEGQMPIDFPFKVLLAWMSLGLFPTYSKSKKIVVDGMTSKEGIILPVNVKFMHKYEYFQIARFPSLKNEFIKNKKFWSSQGIEDLFCFKRFIKNKAEFFQKI